MTKKEQTEKEEKKERGLQLILARKLASREKF
jgi:hypothetical protein